MEGTSTVHLVPFGSGITELGMCANPDFGVPVMILTPFVRAPFSWAARHTTLCLEIWFSTAIYVSQETDTSDPEPHSLWEYPCIACSDVHKIFEFDFKKPINFSALYENSGNISVVKSG